MLDVATAREIVFRHAKPLAPLNCQLGPGRLGLKLAEDVVADIDSPPFDKSMMDGYAVRAADCSSPLKLVGEVQAGAVAATPVGAGATVRIFTGAPIPPGADAVVKQEDATVEGEAVRVQKPVKPGANIFRRGSEMRIGEVVVPAGTVLTPVVCGVLAAAGRESALIHCPPVVRLVVTGNELVEPRHIPREGQIRNTNGPMLEMLAERAGGLTHEYVTVRDDADKLRYHIGEALEVGNVVLLCGGVSVGKYDLVPDALKSLGVEIHFHTVRMKPGKPLLFGTKDGKLVFGLPGNPVSSAVGFELFVRPVIDIMCGRTDHGPKELRVPLSEPLSARHDRPTYHPAVVGVESVRPLPWQGSADLRALLPANGFIVLPPGEVNWPAGETVTVILSTV